MTVRVPARGRVLIVLEQRFERTSDGAIWGPGTAGPSFWARYLEVFDRVTVVARVQDVSARSDQLERCNSRDVIFEPVRYYIGPWGFLKQRHAIRTVAIGALDATCSVILRVPSPIASCLVPHLRRLQKPYAVEVIGDPYDVMSAGAVTHPLRRLFRSVLTTQLRRDCAGAAAAAYVTEYALQQRYPCSGHSVNVSDVELASINGDVAEVFTTHYSSVALTGCLEEPRSYEGRPAGKTRIVTVGSLAQMYKGIDVLIDAVAKCVSNNLDLVLVIVGDGKCRRELEARAAARGICDRVKFTGYQKRDGVTSELDAADIFVLPSRCEGLPRALIEAMARAVPCIASNIGGIPELLPAIDLVAPGDVDELVAVLSAVVLDVNRRAEMSRRNLRRAHDYLDFKLDGRRTAFYRHVRAGTEDWVASQYAS